MSDITFKDNPFILDVNDYKQHIDPINDYIEQTANFISINTGTPLDSCKEWVTKYLRSSPDIKNPKVTFLEREDNGDRVLKEINLLSYINRAKSEDRIFAPTLTTYYRPSRKLSLVRVKVKQNISNRYVEKEKAFKALGDGNKDLAVIKDNEQTNLKLANNSFSGAFVSASNPFFNPTAHSTLTTVTRTTASLANANNEKLITGNRHYWSKDIVYNNIASIISNTDYTKLEIVMNTYNLKYPTIQDTIDCIIYSTNLYWNSINFDKEITPILENLSPIQRAAFVYTGDLYHLTKLNENIVKEFLSKLSSKVTIKLDDPLLVIKKIPGDIANLAHQICNREVKGLGKKYDKMQELGILDTLLGTCINIYNTILEYRLFIESFFVTPNMPASVAFFPKSKRRCVLASDTDSTIFTVQDWVLWYCGQYIVHDESIAVSACIVYLASQTILHILAMFSSNLNYEKVDLFELTLKNEFRFDAFVPTQVSKHYYALIGCREGNVFTEYENEIKGVHLKNSNLPKHINDLGKKLLEDVMMAAIENKTISMIDVLSQIKSTEDEIYNSLMDGNAYYYRKFRLKNPSGYKLDKEKSPYIHHMFWQQVLEAKYGVIDEPPYSCIKISTILHNKTALLEFIDTIQDISIKNKFVDFITRYNKTSFNTMYISNTYVAQHGIPVELRPAINTNKVIKDICKVFYITLETLGYYKPEHLTLREILK